MKLLAADLPVAVCFAQNRADALIPDSVREFQYQLLHPITIPLMF